MAPEMRLRAESGGFEEIQNAISKINWLEVALNDKFQVIQRAIRAILTKSDGVCAMLDYFADIEWNLYKSTNNKFYAVNSVRFGLQKDKILATKEILGIRLQRSVNFTGVIDNLIKYKKTLNRYIDQYNRVPDNCEQQRDLAENLKRRIKTEGERSAVLYTGKCVAAGLGLVAAGGGIVTLNLAVILGGIATITASLWIDFATDQIQKNIDSEIDYIRGIDCEDDDKDDDDKEKEDDKGKTPLPGDMNFNHAPAIAIMDPSGYVYEAVPSNRLPGVTTTLYVKTDDKVEEWEAAEYGEINPQLTNEYGEYGWDVPVGLWQVKYEKDGYQTVYSEWLPVPPPQLDVNMAKVRTEPPAVEDALGYEAGVEIVFDKYMEPALMTAERIGVTREGVSVFGTVALQNEETDPLSGLSFVSDVRFVPDVPFAVGDEVTLTVRKEVGSYAGVGMTEDFVKTLVIRKEATGLAVTPELEILHHDAGTIEVLAEPAEAVAGKRVAARSIAPSIASVTGEATLDAQGRATLPVTAELPGLALIEVSVAGTNLKAEVTVRVVRTKAVAEQVAKPTASVPSGSEVAVPTAVALLSATEGAAIRYTLDGSCPCEAAYLSYTLPVAILEHTVIKAIAVKEGMQDSEVAAFEYFVRREGEPDGGDLGDDEDAGDEPVGTESVDAVLSITPNPVRRSVSNGVIVSVPDNRYEDYTLRIYAVSGALVRDIRLSGPNPPVGQLERGLYIFRLSNRNGSTGLVQKMIVTD
jgi:hypothetical protein